MGNVGEARNGPQEYVKTQKENVTQVGVVVKSLFLLPFGMLAQHVSCCPCCHKSVNKLMSEWHLRLVTGRSARYIAHTVLPLHLTTVCDLNFQPCLKTCKKERLQSRVKKTI